jgi:hypothetical protein
MGQPNAVDSGAISHESLVKSQYARDCAPRDFREVYVRFGSCVTSIAGPNGDAQLYER